MMNETDILKWMEHAYGLAEKAASRDEVPVGAVLVVNNQVLAEGANRREELHRTVAHAEVVALEEYSSRTKEWRLPVETSLFVTAEPCLMCTGALLWARVTHLYYGCSDPRNAGLVKVQPLIEGGVYDHKFQTIKGGVLAEKCGKLMTSFFKDKRTPPPPKAL